MVQVDWPELPEEHVEAVQCFSPVHTEQICEDLKEHVPFPSHITEGLLKCFEELWARVKDHESLFSQAKKDTPVEEEPAV